MLRRSFDFLIRVNALVGRAQRATGLSSPTPPAAPAFAHRLADWLCGALGVSRGGFYAWLKRPRSRRSRSDEELGAKVRASFLASDRTYGAAFLLLYPLTRAHEGRAGMSAVDGDAAAAAAPASSRSSSLSIDSRARGPRRHERGRQRDLLGPTQGRCGCWPPSPLRFSEMRRRVPPLYPLTRAHEGRAGMSADSRWVERRSRFGSLASCSRISVRTSTQSPSFGVGAAPA